MFLTCVLLNVLVTLVLLVFQVLPTLINLKNTFCKALVGVVTQSVQRLAMGWTVWDRIPVGARYSANVQAGAGEQPASCTMGTSPQSSAVAKKD